MQHSKKSDKKPQPSIVDGVFYLLMIVVFTFNIFFILIPSLLKATDQIRAHFWDKGEATIQDVKLERTYMKNGVYTKVILNVNYNYNGISYYKVLDNSEIDWIRGASPETIVTKKYPVKGDLLIYINPGRPSEMHSEEYVKSTDSLIALCFSFF